MGNSSNRSLWVRFWIGFQEWIISRHTVSDRKKNCFHTYNIFTGARSFPPKTSVACGERRWFNVKSSKLPTQDVDHQAPLCASRTRRGRNRWKCIVFTLFAYHLSGFFFWAHTAVSTLFSESEIIALSQPALQHWGSRKRPPRVVVAGCYQAYCAAPRELSAR